MTIRSIALMVIASGLLTVQDAMVKWIAQSYPVGQVMTLRGVFVIATVVLWARARRRTAALRVSNWAWPSKRIEPSTTAVPGR